MGPGPDSVVILSLWWDIFLFDLWEKKKKYLFQKWYKSRNTEKKKDNK